MFDPPRQGISSRSPAVQMLIALSIMAALTMTFGAVLVSIADTVSPPRPNLAAAATASPTPGPGAGPRVSPVSTAPTTTPRPGAVPSPDADQRRRLLIVLEAAAPSLTGATAIHRARLTCAEMLRGMAVPRVVERARVRFAPATPGQARRIVTAIEQIFCAPR
ncbi:hypothetical protein [Rhizohabitans arisaemae]|uniref:hypothetical protein n=1 Tax=Rhizohabitans arisaemae TaxID=2720610 RepID=UPI0024B0DC44|nr:hypothetical protein [Rhizohabitans arisaemae]